MSRFLYNMLKNLNFLFIFFFFIIKHKFFIVFYKKLIADNPTIVRIKEIKKQSGTISLIERIVTKIINFIFFNYHNNTITCDFSEK